VTAPRILVCGAGSVGRRHVANLLALGAEPSVWRERADAAAALQAELGVPVHADLDHALARPLDGVVVATATDRHLRPALAALERGLALFLEKPVSHSADGVAALAASARGRVAEVGCQLRAHPSLRALAGALVAGADGPVLSFRAVVGQRLDAWRPGADYRRGYSADAARGGGALLDLIHELDLVHWLAGPAAEVAASLDRLSDQDLACEDLATLIVRTRAGAVGTVQMDMLSPAYRRDLEVVCARAVWRFDYAAGTLTRADAAGASVVHRVPDGFERNDMFLAHMRRFLDRIADPGLPPLCPLDDGIAALAAALAARRAAASGRFERVGTIQ